MHTKAMFLIPCTTLVAQHQDVSKFDNEAFIMQMNILIKTKQWNDLHAMALNQTSQHPQDIAGWTALGISLSAQNHSFESITAFEKAHSISPENYTCCINLVNAYLKFHDLKNLKSFLSKLQWHYPDIASKIVDREDVFNVLSDETSSPVGLSEWKNSVKFPSMGPYPAVSNRINSNSDASLGGIVILEIYILHDGKIKTINPIAGRKGLFTSAINEASKIRFPALPNSIAESPQRIKIVIVYDAGWERRHSTDPSKLRQMGIGFSAAEANSRLTVVTRELETPFYQKHF